MKNLVWSRRFSPVLLTYFIDTFGLAIVYPVLTPIFLKPQIHLLESATLFERTFLLALLIASFPLAQAIGAPLIGEFSDRIGRKKVFTWTISIGIIGYLLTAFGIHFKELVLMWLGRIITGFFAGNLTLCLSAVADITHTNKERIRNFGWIAVLGGFGFILAILVGGSLSNPHLVMFFRPETPFFLTAFLSFVNLGLLLKYFEESHATKPQEKIEFKKALKNIRSAIQYKDVRTLYIVFFLFMLCWITSMQYLSTYLIDIFDVSANMITLTFVSIGVIWTLANFIINPLLSIVFAASKTFCFGLIVLSTFLFLTLIPNQPFFLFLTYFFIASLAAALCWTNGLATVSWNASELFQGRVLGVNQAIAVLATILGSLIGGVIAGLNVRVLYCFTASSALLGALLLFIRAFEIKKRS